MCYHNRKGDEDVKINIKQMCVREKERVMKQLTDSQKWRAQDQVREGTWPRRREREGGEGERGDRYKAEEVVEVEVVEEEWAVEVVVY